MIHALSILIPTYNNVCLELVKSLQAQAALLPDLEYEILVADDGSNDLSTIVENQGIRNIPCCQYIEVEKNLGRSCIRNLLAQRALHPWLLFIDSNMKVDNPQYLANYQQTVENEVIYGGYKIEDDEEKLRHNLRYLFETAGKQNSHNKVRQLQPYRHFHTSNFIIKRDIMLKHPLDERFKQYGYEDVLYGKTLRENEIAISHIDNPLVFDRFIGNMSFVSKTEESLHTLYQFRKELKGYSKILDYAEKAKRWHLYPICQRLFPLASLPIKAKLTGCKPSLFWFNIYKLLYYIHLDS